MKCSICNGSGRSSLYLGVISEEDQQDPDFMDDYISGKYDRQCPKCKGTGEYTPAELENYNQRRRDAYQMWLEDGRPEGSFSAWYGE